MYFIGVQGDEEFEQILVCKAFPDGIPDVIAYGDNDHSLPFEGDHGVQYARKP
jgi:hypothetical protein